MVAGYPKKLLKTVASILLCTTQLLTSEFKKKKSQLPAIGLQSVPGGGEDLNPVIVVAKSTE